MTHLSFDNEGSLKAEEARPCDETRMFHAETYLSPIMPKAFSIINMTAAAFASVFTVRLTIANADANVVTVVVLSKLIFWFMTGSFVAFLSALLDYGARLLYRIESGNGRSLWKYGEVVDYVAVGMAFASAAVFCSGVWCAFTALQGLDVHF